MVVFNLSMVVACNSHWIFVVLIFLGCSLAAGNRTPAPAVLWFLMMHLPTHHQWNKIVKSYYWTSEKSISKHTTRLKKLVEARR
jgi:hypothetical protein